MNIVTEPLLLVPDVPPLIEALLASDSFHAWAEGTADAEQAAAWERWAARSSAHARAAEEARALLPLLRPPRPPLPDVDGEWRRLQARLQAGPDRPARPPRRIDRWHRAQGRTLAALAVVVLGIVVLTLADLPGRGPDLATASTGLLETRTLAFVGGTHVTLAARSALRYPEAWPADGPREVWLDGEAFFEVAPRPDRADPAFRVHTPDGVVEVLGTAFTVRRRATRTRVVLNTGAVDVHLHERADTLRLRPGDLVEFGGHREAVRRRVNPAVYSSWTTDRLLFDRTPVADVVERIEATYGLRVVVPDSTLLARTLSGSIENHDLDLLLRALARTLDRRVYRDGDAVRIAPRP